MTVHYEQRGHVAVVTLDRPANRNALTPQMVCLLADAWERVAQTPDVRVAVITATGDAFCAGADLATLIPLFTGRREPHDDDERRIIDGSRVFDRAVLRISELDKPVIAAVNGAAVAGGCELVSGCDLRVAADTAQFALQEVRWSLVPGGGSAVRLPAQLPHAIAMEWLLTGARFTAQQAQAWGFVNRVVEPSAVLDEALTLAGTIADNGPLAVQAIKASLRACAGLAEADALEAWRVISDRVLRSEDAAEGPRAFIEKRKPVYRGT